MKGRAGGDDCTCPICSTRKRPIIAAEKKILIWAGKGLKWCKGGKGHAKGTSFEKWVAYGGLVCARKDYLSPCRGRVSSMVSKRSRRG